MGGAHADPGAAVLLEVTGAAKAFGGVPALSDASLRVDRGQVVALLGENGAGKSTLVKALAGVHRLDAGSMRLGGATYAPTSPRDAHHAGVAVIYQEPSLFPDLSLAENIFVANHPTRAGRVDWSDMRRRTARLFEQLEVPLRPEREARGLSIADQQLVEIAKALSAEARLIIMDEPTAALSAAEVDQLMTIARRLRDGGAGIVFISHRLDEVFALCDRATVMRDGVTVSDHGLTDIDVDRVIRDMVGRDLTELYPKLAAERGAPLLEVEGLTRAGEYRDVSLTVRAGEIVALAGLVGSGRSEVAATLFGLTAPDAGRVRLDGADVTALEPAERIARGMALVPEDRRQFGLFMALSIVRNATVTVLDRLRRRGLVSGAAQRQETAVWAERLDLRFASLADPVERLSGGNQQKVVLAKWLATSPRLLIVDEPTRGIDVATKAEVHRLIGEAVRDGLGVLMISSELPEVLGLADAIVVMREGRVVDRLERADASQERIIAAATGATAATGAGGGAG